MKINWPTFTINEPLNLFNWPYQQITYSTFEIDLIATMKASLKSDKKKIDQREAAIKELEFLHYLRNGHFPNE
jgi:hypothetical protein